MDIDTKEEQKEQKPNEDVSKAFGNVVDKKEEPVKETSDHKATEQKIEDPKQKTKSDASAIEANKSKTYTQAEVDAMMAKTSGDSSKKDAQVNKNELDPNVVENDTENSSNKEQMQDTSIVADNDRAAKAELALYMITECDIDPKRAKRAVNLLAVSDIMGNGMIDETKAKTEIEALLQDWPELKTQAISSSNPTNGNGFYFGAPEQEEQNQEEKQKGMFSSIFGNS